jgi:O-succinylbenzoate synthase
LIKPEKRDELMADLENRTGQKINRISIGRIDFLRDTALIKIYFYEE